MIVLVLMNRKIVKALEVPKQLRPLLFFKSFQGAMTILLVYYAIQSLPLVLVSLLSNFIPVMILIFSYFFLKDKI